MSKRRSTCGKSRKQSEPISPCTPAPLPILPDPLSLNLSLGNEVETFNMVDIGGLFESSRLLDWELDSIKTDQGETVARSLINYRHLKTEIQSQCFSLSTQQERLDEESNPEPLTVWVMGSWGALESFDGKTEDAEEYARKKRELTKKIVMLKIQVLCLKQVHVSSCIRQLQVC